ncbi:MAG TPA: MaoC/PaaZ C-terminal domain-containing protein [Dehalococcoidia bacterium]|nr:MaoC/PaaZ C-terminal domain-containing protein [Dehalococcoidia bacterium]
MPIAATIAGRTLGPRSVTLSARRIMAFAAGTDDRNPRYFDDTAEPPLAPPLLAVSLEWPLLVALRGELPGASAEELRRGVHAAHDVRFHRLPRAGETLRTTATIVALQRRPSGTGLLTRLDTIDEADAPVFTTYNGGVYRGVALAGEPLQLDGPSSLPAVAAADGWSTNIEVPWQAAHVYTECAEIWNPIHTERSVALAAGLPDLILHGTATLGYAAQTIVDRVCDGDPTRLLRLGARFGAMVLLGTRLIIRLGEPVACAGGAALGYRVETADGAPAIHDGVALVC